MELTHHQRAGCRTAAHTVSHRSSTHPVLYSTYELLSRCSSGSGSSGCCSVLAGALRVIYTATSCAACISSAVCASLLH
eukprot:14054-Heterococcus_DN1.PRE.1